MECLFFLFYFLKLDCHFYFSLSEILVYLLIYYPTVNLTINIEDGRNKLMKKTKNISYMILLSTKLNYKIL